MTNAVSIFFPDVSQVLGIVGGLAATSIQFMVPCKSYHHLYTNLSLFAFLAITNINSNIILYFSITCEDTEQ